MVGEADEDCVDKWSLVTLLAALPTLMLMSRAGASIEIPIMMSIPITIGPHCSDWSWLCGNSHCVLL